MGHLHMCGPRVSTVAAPGFSAVSVNDFEAARQTFVLYSGGTYDWLTPYLLEKKYSLTLLSKEGDTALYLVER